MARLLDFDAVERTGWCRLRRGDRLELPVRGCVFVLGVVVWSAEDREIFDLAAGQLRNVEGVAIFDLDDVPSAEDLQAFLPGVPLPVHTPVAAEYRNGELVRYATGSDVRTLIGARASL